MWYCLLCSARRSIRLSLRLWGGNFKSWWFSNLDRRDKENSVTLARAPWLSLITITLLHPQNKINFYVLCCCFCCLFYNRSLLSFSTSITYHPDTQSIFCCRELSSNSIWNEVEMMRQEMYRSVQCATRENRHAYLIYYIVWSYYEKRTEMWRLQ